MYLEHLLHGGRSINKKYWLNKCVIYNNIFIIPDGMYLSDKLLHLMMFWGKCDHFSFSFLFIEWTGVALVNNSVINTLLSLSMIFFLIFLFCSTLLSCPNLSPLPCPHRQLSCFLVETVKMELSYDPVISLMGIYLKKLQTWIWKSICSIIYNSWDLLEDMNLSVLTSSMISVRTWKTQRLKLWVRRSPQQIGQQCSMTLESSLLHCILIDNLTYEGHGKRDILCRCHWCIR